MSDSIKKYYEMVEDGHIFESPRKRVNKISGVNEDEWLETYANIARQYPDASVSLLRAFTDDEISVKKVCN